MNELKTGDPLAPVIATHVLGVPEIAGVVFRIEHITSADQSHDTGFMSPNFIMKSAQVRALAKSLLDAANGIDAANKPTGLAT